MLEAVYIARGVNLAGLSPLLKRALDQRRQAGDRFYELWFLVLRAWHQLKLRRPRAATSTITHAVRLAEETGYTRVLLEIPELLPLLAAQSTADRAAWAARSDDALEPTCSTLTLQELTVLRLLNRDYRYEQIAQELRISINTVRTHVRNVYAKLGVSRRADATARAHAVGLL